MRSPRGIQSLLPRAVMLALAASAGSCQPPITAVTFIVALDEAVGMHDAKGIFTVTPTRQPALPVKDEVLCGSTSCQTTLELPSGAFDVTFSLELGDRCSTRSTVAVFRGSSKNRQAGEPNDIITLSAAPEIVLDDDKDGITNLAEVAVCGRFDVPDSDLRAGACVAADDPCCAQMDGAVWLQGQQAVFPPEKDVIFDGMVPAPFLLDATELTWGTLRRCVAAADCLDLGALDERVRAQVTSPALAVDQPVQGLTPAHAMQVCAWLGKRLPTDDEWYFAAAYRPSDPTPARYPFDLDASARLSCTEPPPPGDAAGGVSSSGDVVVAVNQASPGESCARTPAAVGSFTSSFVTRGGGATVADLAGNVAEWTVVPRSGPTADYSEVTEVRLRGGGARDTTALVENSIWFSIPKGNEAALARIAAVAGFRCAADAVSYESVARHDEPMCGAVTPLEPPPPTSPEEDRRGDAPTSGGEVKEDDAGAGAEELGPVTGPEDPCVALRERVCGGEVCTNTPACEAVRLLVVYERERCEAERDNELLFPTCTPAQCDLLVERVCGSPVATGSACGDEPGCAPARALARRAVDGAATLSEAEQACSAALEDGTLFPACGR